MKAPLTETMTEKIIGLDFFCGSLAEAQARARLGGLVLAPSGPGLAYDFVREPASRMALTEADLVLTDSGFLVLLWWLRSGRLIPRHSGLTFLRLFLRAEPPSTGVFWVMPSEVEMSRNVAWLRGQGWKISEEDCYVAPHYGPGMINDEGLRVVLERRRPGVVVIAIGGGVQERLGHALKMGLTYRPGIFCLGAAIAFLTGGQVRIPAWVDRSMLGWLWRIASNFRVYFPRYLRALRLGWLVFRYGRDFPR